MNVRPAVVAVITALTLASPLATAKSHGGSHSGHSSGSHSRGTSTGTHSSHSSSGASHKKRDPAQRAAFIKSHPCPSTGKRSGSCPGYVVDHVTPLKRGGADLPENMQWQTREEAKQKDKWE